MGFSGIIPQVDFDNHIYRISVLPGNRWSTDFSIVEARQRTWASRVEYRLKKLKWKKGTRFDAVQYFVREMLKTAFFLEVVPSFNDLFLPLERYSRTSDIEYKDDLKERVQDAIEIENPTWFPEMLARPKHPDSNSSLYPG